MLLLVAWNLIVYSVLFLVFLTKPGKKNLVSPSSKPAGAKQPTNNRRAAVPEAKINIPRLAQFFMPGLWHFFHRVAMSASEKKKLADVIGRFSVNWYAVAGPLVVARWEVMLHLGALFLATGAWRACISRDFFKVIKRSGAARSSRADQRSLGLSIFSLAQVSWYPICSVLGWQAGSMPPAFSPRLGDKAAAWIHLFAITVMITIVIPRAALAAWQWRNLKRWRNHISLRLDPYYGEVIEASVRTLIEKEVANGAKQFSEDVAAFVAEKLYHDRIVPRLRQFREKGGKVSELKSEIQSLSEAFAPQIESYVTETRLPEFQNTLSQRVGGILKV